MVKEGFISPNNQTQFYLNYLLMLKNKINDIKNDDIISVLWSMITADDEAIPNPLITKLFERLHAFKRDTPLSKEERLMVH